MDSTYKTQLCAQLDHITKLERSGYGLVRKPNETRKSVKSAIACAFVIAILFVIYIVAN